MINNSRIVYKRKSQIITTIDERGVVWRGVVRYGTAMNNNATFVRLIPHFSDVFFGVSLRVESFIAIFSPSLYSDFI